MAAPIIAPEVAADMFSGWECDIGKTLDSETRERILHAIGDGRLDWSGTAFTYRLLVPVAKDGGGTIDSLSIEEPSAGQLMDAAKATNDTEQTLRLLSLISGQPLAVVQRLKQRDLLTASGLIGFFG